jgi:hypothetical protein
LSHRKSRSLEGKSSWNDKKDKDVENVSSS